MKKGTISYIIISFVGVFMIFADQFTKFLVSTKIEYNVGSVNVIKNFFALVNWHNTGAAWGIFSKNTMILAIISIVCAAVIIFLYAQADSAFLKLVLALLSAGAIGNAIDRIINGYVVDFLSFYNLFGYNFPAFNVADICVCSGCIGLLIYVFFLSKKYPAFRENTLAAKIKF